MSRWSMDRVKQYDIRSRSYFIPCISFEEFVFGVLLDPFFMSSTAFKLKLKKKNGNSHQTYTAMLTLEFGTFQNNNLRLHSFDLYETT